MSPPARPRATWPLNLARDRVRLAVVATAIAAVATAIAAAFLCAPFAIAGCAAAAPPPRPPSSSDGGADASNDAASAATSDGRASLETLAARGASDAPLMRELLRVERAAPRSPDVRADRDLCLRALFAASRPVRAWFADEAGATRGEIAIGASGAVPPRGPACASKGESLHLVVEAVPSVAESESPTDARAVLFAAP